jgi:hypothetical protein
VVKNGKGFENRVYRFSGFKYRKFPISEITFPHLVGFESIRYCIQHRARTTLATVSLSSVTRYTPFLCEIADLVSIRQLCCLKTTLDTR